MSNDGENSVMWSTKGKSLFILHSFHLLLHIFPLFISLWKLNNFAVFHAFATLTFFLPFTALTFFPHSIDSHFPFIHCTHIFPSLDIRSCHFPRFRKILFNILQCVKQCVCNDNKSSTKLTFSTSIFNNKRLARPLDLNLMARIFMTK